MKFTDTPIGEIPVGAILAHSTSLDGKRLSKGHRLTEDNLRSLQAAGTKSVVVAILEASDIHEDEAADRLASAVQGTHTTSSGAFTGRCNLFADVDGLLCLDESAITRINHEDESITIATLPNYTRVSRKQMVATIKIIPFAAPKTALSHCEAHATENAITVHPFRALRCAIVQTTLPATKPSVLDKTMDILRQRIESLGGSITREIRCPHDSDNVSRAIATLHAEHPDVILITGASAITDRRDVLPNGLELAGGTVVHFGMPVDPGNLLLLGRYQDLPVIGMPGCARSPKTNGFDWVLQRVFAGLIPTRDEMMDMGIGGLLKEIQTRPQPRNEVARKKDATQPKVTGLVLAAGQSTRMGAENKLTSEIRSQTMVSHVLQSLKDSQVRSILVVTGHNHKEIEASAAEFQPVFVHNPDYAEGLSTSLKRGISAVPTDCDAVLVCLGDMPFVPAEIMDRLIQAYNPTEGRIICIPTIDGNRGNPVLIGRRFFPEIHEIAGDKGAKELIRDYADYVCEVPVDDQSVLIDIDTPEALARYRNSD